VCVCLREEERTRERDVSVCVSMRCMYVCV